MPLLFAPFTWWRGRLFGYLPPECGLSNFKTAVVGARFCLMALNVPVMRSASTHEWALSAEVGRITDEQTRLLYAPMNRLCRQKWGELLTNKHDCHMIHSPSLCSTMLYTLDRRVLLLLLPLPLGPELSTPHSPSPVALVPLHQLRQSTRTHRGRALRFIPPNRFIPCGMPPQSPSAGSDESCWPKCPANP